jgi:hypothetical protein
MKELAVVIGEAQSVHFLRLEVGSTVLVHQVEKEAEPKVRDRAAAVARGDAPRDARIGYKSLNRMLRDDNAKAVLREKKRGPVLLVFPGREAAEEVFPSVTQHGSVEGTIIRVGGSDDTIPVWLESEGIQIAGCQTNRRIAKAMAKHLFEPVRVHGNGRWTRDADGVWSLRALRIEHFEVLRNDSLEEVLSEIRSVGGEWDEGSLGELRVLRHGEA